MLTCIHTYIRMDACASGQLRRRLRPTAPYGRIIQGSHRWLRWVLSPLPPPPCFPPSLSLPLSSLFLCLYLFAYTCVCVYVCVCVSFCVRANVIRVCVYMLRVYVCVCVCVCVCTYKRYLRATPSDAFHDYFKMLPDELDDNAPRTPHLIDLVRMKQVWVCKRERESERAREQERERETRREPRSTCACEAGERQRKRGVEGGREGREGGGGGKGTPREGPDPAPL